MIDWTTEFEALDDAEKDKLALLRVIECTNGVIQHSYRNGDDDLSLTLDEVREAMRFSMGCMKRMEIPVGEHIVRFSPESIVLFSEMRRLYISGQKQNNPVDFSEFLRGSKANLIAVGKDRIIHARRLAFEHIDALPPHTLEWGVSYIFSFAGWF